MLSRFAILATCAVLFGLAGAAPAQENERPAAARQSPAREAEKAFDEAVRGYRKQPGLFTIYTNPEENRVLVEIRPDQFDRLYMGNLTLEAGDGLYFDSGAMLDNFPFVLRRIGKRVQMIHRNLAYRTQPGATLAPAVERGVSSSLIASARLESRPHPVSRSVLVDLANLLVQDYPGVEPTLARAGIEFKFDRNESYLGQVRTFERNTEAEVVLHFRNNRPRPTDERIADGRSMQHRYRYSFAALVPSDYRPRRADDRVGHFLTLYQDYTDPTGETPYVRYINRWRLEKADPGAALSPPVEPIVFWLEKTIPVEYRQAVAEGALLWNRAFERIGFKDALVVRQQPDDAEWDPADVRYNTIRWIVQPGGAYAVGPSHTDPFTGQIYDADIRISADFVRYLVREREDYVAPLSGVDASRQLLTPYLSRLGPAYFCQFEGGLAAEAAFGWNVLTTREVALPQLEKAYIDSAIRALVAHEVGHVLGLRHNFRGSTYLDNRLLQDALHTRKNGLTGSVMDYAPVNLAPQRGRQGEFWTSTLGEYDYWAIAYAYQPFAPEQEATELALLASRNLPYATDEDTFGTAPQGIDPSAYQFDLGADPLVWWGGRLTLARELLTGAERTLLRPGDRYPRLRRIFSQSLRAYAGAAAAVPRYVGGLYLRRDHVGDPGGRKPFEPVRAGRQRQALAFLDRHLFGPKAFAFAPNLLNQLAPERLEDFSQTPFRQMRLDYPMHQVVLDIQRQALDRLFHPLTLQRLQDLPLHYRPGTDRFGLVDLFDGVHRSIWQEAERHSPVNSFRRNLQRAHLDLLVGMVVQPQGMAVSAPFESGEEAVIAPPEDARTLARKELRTIRASLVGALADRKLDALTRAHYDESLARIGAALDAGLLRRAR